jgi:hypothetical protein
MRVGIKEPRITQINANEAALHFLSTDYTD